MSDMSLRLLGRLQVLNEKEINLLHKAILHVLERTGVRFKDEKSREVLKRAGAKTDGEIVKFPSELVNDSIKQSPQKVILGARNVNKRILLGKSQILFTNGCDAAKVVDLRSKVYRDATLQDLKDFIRICDYLKNVDYCLNQVIPQDVPPPLIDPITAFVMLNNTEKNVHLGPTNADYLEEVIELGEIVSDRTAPQEIPVYTLGCCPASPLTYSADATITLMEAAKRNIPFLIVSGAIAGATAPVTLAGTLVVQNAEILAGIVLAQTVSPGAPIVYGSFASPMDMRRGKQLLGVPELALMNVATSQLCNHYQIPFGYGTGGYTDAISSGIQAGFEKGSTTLFGALGGVEVIHVGASGILGTAMVASYEQLILDNEYCNMVKRYLRGIDISNNTLALDIIEEVGPGGNFIELNHTLQNFKKELYLSDFWNIDQNINDKKRDTVLDGAAKEAEKILKSHSPPHLDDYKNKKMIEVLKKADVGDVYIKKIENQNQS